MLDADGLPSDGPHTLDFRLYDAAEDGSVLWSESYDVDLINGYYSLILGADELLNPLEDSLLRDNDLFLELTVGDDEALSPRQALTAVPYARLAGTATSVNGGTVNTSEIRIDGAMVVDTSGNWVGPTPAMDWSDISGIPADFSDAEDADTWLSEEEVDTWLSEEEVDEFCNNNGYALSAELSAIATSGSYDDLSGVPADADTQLSEDEVDAFCNNNGYATGSHTTDTNTQLSEGEVDTMVSNNGYSTGSHTADTNTQLSESTVETYVTNAAIDLASGSTIGGSAPFTLADLGSRIYQQTYTTPHPWPNVVGTATCDSGDKVLGGGCRGGCYQVKVSGPSGEGWYCRCTSTTTGSITITAICLDL